MTEEVASSPWPRVLRLVGAAFLGLCALAALGVQVSLIFAPPPQGDAMGAGMERAFREMIVWGIAPFEAGFAGLACGLALSARVAPRVAPLGVAVAAVDWLVTAVFAGVLVGLGLSPGAAETAGVVGLCLWMVGFFAVGLSMGASRSLGTFGLAVLPLPLALLAPPLLYLAQS